MAFFKAENLNKGNTSITLVNPMQLSVKNVEKNVFQEFKAESVREGFPVGKSLTLAMKLWLEQKKKKKKKSLLDYKARSWGKATEHLSEQVDEVLY